MGTFARARAIARAFPRDPIERTNAR